MFKILLSLLLCFTVSSAFGQRLLDTFSVYFDLNVPTLNKNAEKKIDLLIYNDKILAGSSVMVKGYADFLGSEQYNKNLSMQRAKNIKDYLIKYGINAQDIKLCVGEGEVIRQDMTDKEGNPDDRRVDIIVNNKFKTSEQFRKPKTDDHRVASLKDTGNIAAKKNKSVDLKELSSLKEGQTLLLKNVYFPPGSHIIKPESYQTLEKLYTVLKDNPRIKISIEGHVCCIHSDVPDALDMDTNEPVLSLNRAKAIFQFLVNKGIDENRLEYAGFGKRFPIIPFEKTEEDAEKNRRVEVRITSNQ